MQGFPKSLLALAFFNLIAVLLSVFFLFGGMHIFGVSENGCVNVLLYVADQLLWLLPVTAFFASLKLYDYDKKALSYICATAGCLLTLFDCYLLFG